MKSQARLMTLAEARAYLAGLDPRTLGVPAWTPHPLRFDRRAIDAALDARLDASGRQMLGSAANDADGPAPIDDELADLDARLEARAAALSPEAPRLAPRRKA